MVGAMWLTGKSWWWRRWWRIRNDIVSSTYWRIESRIKGLVLESSKPDLKIVWWLKSSYRMLTRFGWRSPGNVRQPLILVSSQPSTNTIGVTTALLRLVETRTVRPFMFGWCPVWVQHVCVGPTWLASTLLFGHPRNPGGLLVHMNL